MAQYKSFAIKLPDSPIIKLKSVKKKCFRCNFKVIMKYDR